MGHRLRPLDGMRAFAVAAVLLVHAGVPWAGGGFLGVDVFFVLSGFLITSLLCAEFGSDTRIQLGRFWGRRARRLLPGLFLLLLGVAIYALLLRDQLDLGAIRADALSTLLYVANWHFIATSQNYFQQTAAPSPLLHMWSLSVEEQYYLLWPLVAVLVLRRGGSRTLATVAAVGAAGSAALMAVLYGLGSSTDRLYFGTDTRAQALLVGSALGALAARRGGRIVDRERITAGGRRLGSAVGVVGALALVWLFHTASGQSGFLYEGGFFLVALAAGAVIVTVTSDERSILGRLCSLGVLVYLGRISYGLYLYHWPLFLAIDHGHTGLSGATLMTARLAATLAAAVLSFHLVEQPIRSGTFTRHRHGVLLGAGGALATAGMVVLATVAPAAATATPVHTAPPPVSLEHQLVAAHATTTAPVRFLLVGDSVALTTARGLRLDSVAHDGVAVTNKGVEGCDLDLVSTRLAGTVWPSAPGINCGSWRQLWAADVDRFHPEVVGLIIGRFEVADHLWDGQWVHVGEPAWDQHLVDDLDQAVGILSSQGAHVVMFTFPYINPPQEQPDGSPWPENAPSRVDSYNRVIREVAAAHPATVSLIDLNRLLDPAGHFTTTVDGVEVRYPTDGIHVTEAGGEWLQSRVLPTVARLGLAVRAAQARLGLAARAAGSR